MLGRVAFRDPRGEEVIPPTLDFAEEKKHHFARGLFPAHQGTIARRRALLDLGGFDETYRIAADYKIALQLSLMQAPTQVETVLATFHTGGVSSTHWRASIREFHDARLEILGIQGWQRVSEGYRTGRQYVSMAAARALGRVRS